jgi:menaquinone-dependent protoporphyrinogen IX oxidase
MRIEYLHASKFGNGATVAREFERQMADRGSSVAIHHIKQMDPTRLPDADLYVISSPGRFGKPIRSMRRFLHRLSLPAGTRYAVLTTEMAPKPDKTGRMPSDDEVDRWQRVRPIIDEILEPKRLTKVLEGHVFVTGMRGPLEDGWQRKVETFAADLARQTASP